MRYNKYIKNEVKTMKVCIIQPAYSTDYERSDIYFEEQFKKLLKQYKWKTPGATGRSIDDKMMTNPGWILFFALYKLTKDNDYNTQESIISKFYQAFKLLHMQLILSFLLTVKSTSKNIY